MDAGAIERLGEAMAESHSQEASITTPELSHQPESRHRPEQERDPGAERESEAALAMREQQGDRDLGWEPE